MCTTICSCLSTLFCCPWRCCASKSTPTSNGSSAASDTTSNRTNAGANYVFSVDYMGATVATNSPASTASLQGREVSSITDAEGAYETGVQALRKAMTTVSPRLDAFNKNILDNGTNGQLVVLSSEARRDIEKADARAKRKSERHLQTQPSSHADAAAPERKLASQPSMNAEQLAREGQVMQQRATALLAYHEQAEAEKDRQCGYVGISEPPPGWGESPKPVRSHGRSQSAAHSLQSQRHTQPPTPSSRQHTHHSHARSDFSKPQQGSLATIINMD